MLRSVRYALDAVLGMVEDGGGLVMFSVIRAHALPACAAPRDDTSC
ncbi:MAG: hypothetical protein K2X49_08980 [Acetobacteraceae bacterium]|nr:hypothetical protein [Acetobacteraceae bacterium]